MRKFTLFLCGLVLSVLSLPLPAFAQTYTDNPTTSSAKDPTFYSIQSYRPISNGGSTPTYLNAANPSVNADRVDALGAGSYWIFEEAQVSDLPEGIKAVYIYNPFKGVYLLHGETGNNPAKTSSDSHTKDIWYLNPQSASGVTQTNGVGLAVRLPNENGSFTANSLLDASNQATGTGKWNDVINNGNTWFIAEETISSDDMASMLSSTISSISSDIQSLITSLNSIDGSTYSPWTSNAPSHAKSALENITAPTGDGITLASVATYREEYINAKYYLPGEINKNIIGKYITFSSLRRNQSLTIASNNFSNLNTSASNLPSNYWQAVDAGTEGSTNGFYLKNVLSGNYIVIPSQVGNGQNITLTENISNATLLQAGFNYTQNVGVTIFAPLVGQNAINVNESTYGSNAVAYYQNDGGSIWTIAEATNDQIAQVSVLSPYYRTITQLDNVPAVISSENITAAINALYGVFTGTGSLQTSEIETAFNTFKTTVESAPVSFLSNNYNIVSPSDGTTIKGENQTSGQRVNSVWNLVVNGSSSTYGLKSVATSQYLVPSENVTYNTPLNQSPSDASLAQLVIKPSSENVVALYLSESNDWYIHQGTDNGVCYWEGSHNWTVSGLDQYKTDITSYLMAKETADEMSELVSNVTALFPATAATALATAITDNSNPLLSELATATTALNDAITQAWNTLNEGPIILKNGDENNYVYLQAIPASNGNFATSGQFQPQRSTAISTSNVFSFVKNATGRTVKLRFDNVANPTVEKYYLGPAGAGSNTSGGDLTLGYKTIEVNGKTLSGLTIELPNGGGYLCSRVHEGSGNTHGESTGQNWSNCIWTVENAVLPTGISAVTATPDEVAAATEAARNVTLVATLEPEGVTPGLDGITFTATAEGEDAITITPTTTDEGVTTYTFSVPANDTATDVVYTIGATTCNGIAYTPAEGTEATTVTAKGQVLTGIKGAISGDAPANVTLNGAQQIKTFNVTLTPVPGVCSFAETGKFTATMTAEAAEEGEIAATLDAVIAKATGENVGDNVYTVTVTIPTDATATTYTLGVTYKESETATETIIATFDEDVTLTVEPQPAIKVTIPTDKEYTFSATATELELDGLTIEYVNLGEDPTVTGKVMKAAAEEDAEATEVTGATVEVSTEDGTITVSATSGLEEGSYYVVLSCGDVTSANIPFTTTNDPVVTVTVTDDSEKTFPVNKQPATINVNVTTENVGEDATTAYSAKVYNSSNEEVTGATATLDATEGTLTIRGLAEGTYTVCPVVTVDGTAYENKTNAITVTVEAAVLEVATVTAPDPASATLTLGNQTAENTYAEGTVDVAYTVNLALGSAALTEDDVTITEDDAFNAEVKSVEVTTAATETAGAVYTATVKVSATAMPAADTELALNVTIGGKAAGAVALTIAEPALAVSTVTATAIDPVTVDSESAKATGSAVFTIALGEVSRYVAESDLTVTPSKGVEVASTTLSGTTVTVAYTAAVGNDTITLAVGGKSAEAIIVVNLALPDDETIEVVNPTEDKEGVENESGADITVTNPTEEDKHQEVSIAFTVPEATGEPAEEDIFVALPIASANAAINYAEYLEVVSSDENVATGTIEGTKVKVTLADNAKPGQEATLYVVRKTDTAAAFKAIRALADGDEANEDEGENTFTAPTDYLIEINVTTKPAVEATGVTVKASTNDAQINRPVTFTADLTLEPKDGAASAFTLTWEVTGGTEGTDWTIDANGLTATVTFLTAGTYTVTVSVDDTQLSAQTTVRVTVPTGPIGSGIDAINADAAEGRAAIYDLQGRRLERINAAGLYIVNGVKTLVR